LRAEEVVRCDGIPVTAPCRTILDIAATLDRRPLERLLDRAEELRLFDLATLDALVRAHAGHRGAKRLRDALATHTAGSTLTRSELEERFLALCDAAGLARPRVAHPLGTFTADFLFEPARVVVETDGWTHHRTRRAFEHDRRRDATLLRAGYRTLRFTHRQIEDDPRAVAATLAAVLSP
jgi:very-short-patch-repair endonuclease